MTTEIDTGDRVNHTPTGEDWIVAYVTGDRLAWCGWPNGEATLKDCTLVHKCDPTTRDDLLHELAGVAGNDRRAVYARKRLLCNVGAVRHAAYAAKRHSDAACP